jgi:1-acyl-sn-glycerol-3-phosphate acyltransferase
VLGVEGAQHLAGTADPFILALNHSQKREAILIPCALAALRNGRQIHFMADWNFLLIPVIGTVIRLNEPIIVNRKSARPRFLNVFRPLLTSRQSVIEQARQKLQAGRSIGIFPEGTVNRDQRRLLRGFSGVAQLSLELGVPVVPAGVRFPETPRETPVPETARFTLHLGPPLRPEGSGPTTLKATRDWHGRIMSAIAGLSGKHWSPENARTKYETCPEDSR